MPSPPGVAPGGPRLLRLRSSACREDRRAALIPIDPDDTRKGAMYLTGAGVLAALLALFQQVWDIATPLGAARDPGREGATAQERALLKLLAQGLTDEAAATRLGVSHRTARRMMADLMERLQARSRFEAGLRAAHRGMAVRHAGATFSFA